MKSIVSNERECLVCKATCNLERHHIYFGSANRKLSDKYGCTCYLCTRHHRDSKVGVHCNRTLDLKLKQICQKKWENRYGGRDKFRDVFGKSYI